MGFLVRLVFWLNYFDKFTSINSKNNIWTGIRAVLQKRLEKNEPLHFFRKISSYMNSGGDSIFGNRLYDAPYSVLSYNVSSIAYAFIISTYLFNCYLISVVFNTLIHFLTLWFSEKRISLYITKILFVFHLKGL